MATAAKRVTIEETPATLSAAMAAAFADFEAAGKNANNPHFRSKYADLSAVMDAIKPALVANGLFFTQATHDKDGGVCVETVIHHASGENYSCGLLFVPASKNDAQGFGSALTYARRYSLMTAFGIPAEDDDGNAAAKSVPAANDRERPVRPATESKIDDAQFAQLVTLIEAKKVDTPKFCRFMGFDSLKAIPASRFQDALTAIRSKPDPVNAKPAQSAQRSEFLDDEIPY